MVYLKENLKYLRATKNLTQQEISDLLGVKKNTYGNYETGYSTPDFLVLQKISNLFGFTVDELLFRTLSKKEPTERKEPTENIPASKQPDSYSALLEAKEQIISTQQETIDAQKQTISFLAEELQHLKREAENNILGNDKRTKRSASAA